MSPEHSEISTCHAVTGALQTGDNYIVCDQPVTGRFVLLQMANGQTAHLTICEFEVYGQPGNHKYLAVFDQAVSV